MAITISGNADVVKGLFASNFGTTDILGINYTDYASIKNGSYHKLLSAYYSLDKTEKSTSVKDTQEETKKEESTSTKPVTGTSTSTSTSSVAAEKLATIESGAEKLEDAADTLLTQGSGSVFNLTAVKDANGNEVKDADGNVTTDYDKDKIYSSVKNFVDQYNTLVESASNTSVSSIKSTISAMKYDTLSSEDELAAVGISFNKEDNTLSIDEEKFKNSDMSKVKKLFNGTNSYAYQVAEQASTIDKYAEHEASRANTYTDSGAYSNNHNTGSILEDLI